MLISANTTRMTAGLTVMVDRDAREHCVVVVKGTFQTRDDGALSRHPVQQPLAETDVYYGDPTTSCIRYPCDFVLEKPQADVLVVGKAVAPGGKAVRELLVRLEVDGRTKDVLVFGDRRWISGAGFVPSEAVPFTEMPLTFDRAFGGSDDSRGPTLVDVEWRNLVGVGFHRHRRRSDIEGTALPNLEDPGHRLRSPYDTPAPAGFGCSSPNWFDRARYAGTYDDTWWAEQSPFLPSDFDARFFQSAPLDQQFPEFCGGEVICCHHMATEPVVRYRVPTSALPVTFGFADRLEAKVASLDTVILEPHVGAAMLVWRAHMPLPKRLTELREVFVGTGAAASAVREHRGKPYFSGLDAAIRWLRQNRINLD